MSEFQVVIIASLFIIITSSLVVSLAFDSVQRRLRSIERLLVSEQNTHNEDEVTNGDGKNEESSE